MNLKEADKTHCHLILACNLTDYELHTRIFFCVKIFPCEITNPPPQKKKLKNQPQNATAVFDDCKFKTFCIPGLLWQARSHTSSCTLVNTYKKLYIWYFYYVSFIELCTNFTSRKSRLCGYRLCKSRADLNFRDHCGPNLMEFYVGEILFRPLLQFNVVYDHKNDICC